MAAVTLIENVAIGDVPPTPAQPIIDDALTPIATESLMTIGRSYGFPIGYIQEQKGQLIQNILPVHKTESQQISTSSKTELQLHTETAFHPYKPSYVMLLCMRGDPNAVTTYSLVEDVLEELTEEQIAILQHPLFITSIDQSFRTDGEPDMELKTQILRFVKPAQTIEFTFDWAFMRGMNDEASHALSAVRDAIGKTIRDVVLKAGDLFVIDNKCVVHGRKPFQARYDGTDRWLKRLLVKSTRPPKAFITGNTITMRFPAK